MVIFFSTNRCLCLFFICDNFTCFKLKILNYFTEFHSSLLFIILCDFTYSTNYFFNFTSQFQLFPHIHHNERTILFFIHKHSINFPYAPQMKTQGNGSLDNNTSFQPASLFTYHHSLGHWVEKSTKYQEHFLSFPLWLTNWHSTTFNAGAIITFRDHHHQQPWPQTQFISSVPISPTTVIIPLQ